MFIADKYYYLRRDLLIDILLYNGFTPRRRSPGDVYFDHGISLLRSYLNKNGIECMVEDKITLDGYKEFDNTLISIEIGALLKKLIFLNKKNSCFRKYFYKIRLKKLYNNLIKHHEIKMESYLESIAEKVSKYQISVVGMKVWFGSSFRYCIKLYNMIKAMSPNTIVVIGGPHVNCFSYNGMILKYTPFDLAVYSEGEEALLQIVRIAKKYKKKDDILEAIFNANISNLIFRYKNKVFVTPVSPINIDDKLIPEYTEYELNNKLLVHTIIDGLGCDYAKCKFCIHPRIYPKFQLRDPKLIVDEIEYMISKGIGLFAFTASDTPLPHAKKISEEILRRKLNIEYTMLTRVLKGAEKRKEYLIDSFRSIIRAGMRIIYLGVECGNDDILREVMNKGITTEDIINTMECIKKAIELEKKRVYIINSYIFPIPLTTTLLNKGITIKGIFKDNLHIIKRTLPDFFQITPAIVFPGTAWYCNSDEYNIDFKENNYAKYMLESEMPGYSFGSSSFRSPYSFSKKSILKLLPLYKKLSHYIEELGIPNIAGEENIVIANCSGYYHVDDIKEFTKKLLIDLIACQSEKINELLMNVNKKSREIAALNKS